MSVQRGSKKKSAPKPLPVEDMVDIWADIVLSEDHAQARYGLYAALCQDALNGEAYAVRQIKRVFQTIRKAQKRLQRECPPEPRDERRRDAAKEHNADLAMLILGIAVINNSALRKGGAMDEPDNEAIALKLKPTHLAAWVRDLAASRAGSDRLQYDSGFVSDDHPDLADWQVVADRVIAARLRRSGPHGGRFVKGETGNRRGRPRQPRDIHQPHQLPFSEFFLDPVTLPLPGGGERLGTRLDRVMMALYYRTLKRDQKLHRLLMPILLDLREEYWHDLPDSADIIRG